MKAYSVIPDLNNQAKEILKNSNITLTINEGGGPYQVQRKSFNC